MVVVRELASDDWELLRDVRLIEAAAGWAKGRGHDTLYLWVTESNAPARRLYERYGFTPTGERQPLPSDSALSEIQLSRPL